MSEEKCIEYIKEVFNGNEYETMSVEDRRSIYKNCEDYCSQEGITGVQFDMLWNKAMFQIKAGI